MRVTLEMVVVLVITVSSMLPSAPAATFAADLHTNMYMSFVFLHINIYISHNYHYRSRPVFAQLFLLPGRFEVHGHNPPYSPFSSELAQN